MIRRKASLNLPRGQVIKPIFHHSQPKIQNIFFIFALMAIHRCRLSQGPKPAAEVLSLTSASTLIGLLAVVLQCDLSFMCYTRSPTSDSSAQKPSPLIDMAMYVPPSSVTTSMAPRQAGHNDVDEPTLTMSGARERPSGSFRHAI